MYFDNFLCVCLLPMSSFMLPIQYLCLLQRIRGDPPLSPLLQLFPPASPPSLSPPSSTSFDFMNCDIYEHSDYVSKTHWFCSNYDFHSVETTWSLQAQRLRGWWMAARLAGLGTSLSRFPGKWTKRWKHKLASRFKLTIFSTKKNYLLAWTAAARRDNARTPIARIMARPRSQEEGSCKFALVIFEWALRRKWAREEGRERRVGQALSWWLLSSTM